MAYVNGGGGKAYRATFIVGTASGSQTVSIDAASARSAFLFVTHRPDAKWIQLADVSEEGGADYRDCATPSPMAEVDWAVTPTFDDTAGWIAQGTTTGVSISRPHETTVLQPDYPAELRKRQLQGACRVAVDVDANGTVADAELIDTSGNPELDAIALKAAMGQRFVPARLPASAGGGNTAAALEESFIFSPGMVTVRER